MREAVGPEELLFRRVQEADTHDDGSVKPTAYYKRWKPDPFLSGQSGAAHDPG